MVIKFSYRKLKFISFFHLISVFLQIMFVSKQYFVRIFIMQHLRSILCEMQSKIVGGSITTTEANPHAVFISGICYKEQSFKCGASILTQNILITAAHCLHGCQIRRKEHYISAYTGHENYRKSVSVRTIIDYIIHQEYHAQYLENDIGIALLHKSLKLGSNTMRVIISKNDLHTQDGIVAGWGITNEKTKVTSPILKSVWQKIRSPGTCEIMIGDMEPGMFCAGSKRNDEDHPASGDSGSGFISNGLFMIGLVSFRLDSLPALTVYTNVTFYYDWIRKTSQFIYCREH